MTNYCIYKISINSFRNLRLFAQTLYVKLTHCADSNVLKDCPCTSFIIFFKTSREGRIVNTYAFFDSQAYELKFYPDLMQHTSLDNSLQFHTFSAKWLVRFYLNFQRREYPDGTVKILYEDGRQETQYSSGLATKANIIIFCSFPKVLTVRTMAAILDGAFVNCTCFLCLKNSGAFAAVSLVSFIQSQNGIVILRA